MTDADTSAAASAAGAGDGGRAASYGGGNGSLLAPHEAPPDETPGESQGAAGSSFGEHAGAKVNVRRNVRSHDDVAQLADAFVGELAAGAGRSLNRQPSNSRRSAYATVVRSALNAAHALSDLPAPPGGGRQAGASPPLRAERSRLSKGAVRSEEDFMRMLGALDADPAADGAGAAAAAAAAADAGGAAEEGGLVGVQYRVFDMLEVARTLRLPYAALVNGLLAGNEHYAVQQTSPLTSVDHSLPTVPTDRSGSALISPVPPPRPVGGTYQVSLPDTNRDELIHGEDPLARFLPPGRPPPEDDGAQHWVGLLVGLPCHWSAAAPPPSAGRKVDHFDAWHQSSARPPAVRSMGRAPEPQLLEWEVPVGEDYPTHAGFLVAVPPEPPACPARWSAGFLMLPQVGGAGLVDSAEVAKSAADADSRFARTLGSADCAALARWDRSGTLSETDFLGEMRRLTGQRPAQPRADRIVFATTLPHSGVAGCPLCARCGDFAASLQLRRPSEVLSVTVLLEPRPGDPSEYDPLSGVFISVQLARPWYAWIVLLIALFAASTIPGLFARMRAHADSGSLAGLWAAQAAVIGFALPAAAVLIGHRWVLHEGLFFRSLWGAGSVAGFGFLGGLRVALCAASFGGSGRCAAGAVTVPGGDAREASVQRFALAAFHPLCLIAWRLGRQQHVFLAEATGALACCLGLVLIAYPGSDGSSFGTDELFALLSCVATAGELLSAKVFAAQLPAVTLLFPACVVGLIPNVVAAGIAGVSGSRGCKGFFGWVEEDAFGWWIRILIASCAAMTLYLHAMRYMHPIAVASAQSLAAALSVFWADGPFDVHVKGLSDSWAVPGTLVVACASAATAHVVLNRRQIVECEVTEVQKRQHVRQSLTMDNLTKNQQHFGTRLYQACEDTLIQEHQRAQEERRRRRQSAAAAAAGAAGGADGARPPAAAPPGAEAQP